MNFNQTKDETEELRALFRYKLEIVDLSEEDIAYLLEKAKNILKT